MLETRAFQDAHWTAFDGLRIECDAEGFRFLSRFADEHRGGTAERAHETWLTVWDDEELVAFGGLTADPYAASPEVGRLRHLYVRRSRREHGIGRALVHALELAARETYAVVRLRTDTTDAARFYERLGYEALETGEGATHMRHLTEPPR